MTVVARYDLSANVPHPALPPLLRRQGRVLND